MREEGKLRRKPCFDGQGLGWRDSLKSMSLVRCCTWSQQSPFSSVPQSCPTLCNPVDCSTPGFPDHHQLWKLAQIHVHRVGDPSNHLILSRPLLLLTESTDFPQRGKLATTQLSHALKVSLTPLSDVHPREKAAGPCIIISGWCNGTELPHIILANAPFCRVSWVRSNKTKTWEWSFPKEISD